MVNACLEVKLAEFKSLSQGSWDLMHLFTHLPSAADAGSAQHVSSVVVNACLA